MDCRIYEDIFADYQQAKREAVKEPNVDSDIPMLLYLGDRPIDEPEAAVLCIVIPSGDAGDLLMAMSQAMAQVFIPYWAALVSDAFIAKGDAVDGERPAGYLEELFHAGDDRVVEGLTITAANHEGEVYANSRPYWFDDDGDLWFRDEEGPLVDDSTSGPMITVLKDVTSLWGKTQAEVLAAIMERMPDMN